MKIGIDLDNVLNKYDKTFGDYWIYKKQHGYKASDNIFDMERAEFECLLQNKLEVQPKAVEVTQELINQGHEVYVITSTQPENMKFKEDWLKKHFPHLDKLIMVQDKNMIKVDVLIDDSLEQLDNFDGHKIVFDTPKNRTYPKKHYRMFEWVDVFNILDEIFKPCTIGVVSDGRIYSCQ